MNVKPEIKVGFVDTFDGASQFFMDLLNGFNNISVKFIRDDNDPQILFFGDATFGNKNKEYTNPIKIFYTGENIRPGTYPADYYITFDHFDAVNHFRLPLYYINMHYLETRFNLTEPWISNKPFERDFASFIQSNPNCIKRNQLFNGICDNIKVVNSAGPLFNNVGHVLPRGEDGVIKKMQFMNKHKFALAFENGQYPGYATEKLLEAHLAGSVPIYWGSSTISMDFNPKSFINWHDYKDDNLFYDQIKLVNSNEEMYMKYYDEPLFTDKHNVTRMKKHFELWFTNILQSHSDILFNMRII